MSKKKKCKKAKWLSEESLQIAVKSKRRERERRKGKIFPFESRVPKNSKEKSLSCIGEGNGNALQCSCLENPRDRGAWWAAVYVVAQSSTQLKQLSSSSSKEK